MGVYGVGLHGMGRARLDLALMLLRETPGERG
jgi:hypothetical protein